MLHEADCGCLNLRLLARVALGNLRRTAIATGETNGQAGGLLVETDTTEVSDTFSAAPEFGVSLGYQFSPCMEVRRRLHAPLLEQRGPPGRADRQLSAATARPSSSAKTSFWVQGFHAGLTMTF